MFEEGLEMALKSQGLIYRDFIHGGSGPVYVERPCEVTVRGRLRFYWCRAVDSHLLKV